MMFSSSHIILALALSFPLLSLGVPTKRSQYSLPPPLAASKVALVRERAIQLSTHRSVFAPCLLLPLTTANIDEQRTVGKSARSQRH